MLVIILYNRLFVFRIIDLFCPAPNLVQMREHFTKSLCACQICNAEIRFRRCSLHVAWISLLPTSYIILGGLFPKISYDRDSFVNKHTWKVPSNFCSYLHLPDSNKWYIMFLPSWPLTWCLVWRTADRGAWPQDPEVQKGKWCTTKPWACDRGSRTLT